MPPTMVPEAGDRQSAVGLPDEADGLLDVLNELKLEKFHDAILEETGCDSLGEIVQNIADKSDLGELVKNHGMKPMQLNKLYNKIQEIKERMSEASSSWTRISMSRDLDSSAPENTAGKHTSSSVDVVDKPESPSVALPVDGPGKQETKRLRLNETKHGSDHAASQLVDKIPTSSLKDTLPPHQFDALMNVVDALSKGKISSQDMHNLEPMIDELFENKSAKPFLQQTFKVLTDTEPSLYKFTMHEEGRWLYDLSQATQFSRPQYIKKFDVLAKRDPSLASRIWHQKSPDIGWLPLPERCNHNYLRILKSPAEQQLLGSLEDAKEIALDSSNHQALGQQRRINDQLLPELRKINEALAAEWVQRNLHELKYEWVMEPSNKKRLEKADKILKGHFRKDEIQVLLAFFCIEPDEASTLPWEQFCKEHLTPKAVELLKKQPQLEPLSADDTEDLVQKLDDLMNESEPLATPGPAQRKQHLLWPLSDFVQDLSILGVNSSDLVTKVGLGLDEGIHLLYQAMGRDSDIDASHDNANKCNSSDVWQALVSVVLVLPFLSLINTILKEFAPMYFKDVMDILVPAIVQERMHSMEDLRSWLETQKAPESMASGVRRFLKSLSRAHWDQIYASFCPEGPFRAESEDMRCLNYVDELGRDGSSIKFQVDTFSCSAIDENAMPKNTKYERACETLKRHKVYTVEVALAEPLELEELLPIPNMRKILLEHLTKRAEEMNQIRRELQVQLYFNHGSVLKLEQSQDDGGYQYDLETSTHKLTCIVVSSKAEAVPEVVKNYEASEPTLHRPARISCIDPNAEWPRVVKCGEALPRVHLELNPPLKKFKVRACARGCLLEGAGGCELDGAGMVGRDGECKAHLQLQNSESQTALVFSTVIVFEVLDGPVKGMKLASPPIQVEGVRVSKSKNELGQYISAVTSVAEALRVQQGVPFRLAFDLLVPYRGPWSISVKDSLGMLRQVQHSEFTTKHGTVDLVFPDGQELQSQGTKLHVEVSVPHLVGERHGRQVKKQRTSHDLIFDDVRVHSGPKVRSDSWYWAALHDYKPDEKKAQLQEFSTDTLRSFPMLLRNGNEIKMSLKLIPSDGHESAYIILNLASSAPLPKYHLTVWLQDGPRPVQKDGAAPENSEFHHNFAQFEVRVADMGTFYVQLVCSMTSEAHRAFSAEPFLEEYQDISNQLGEMKPVECLAKLGELGFSLDGREKSAFRNLQAACEVAQAMGLDLRNLRRADLLVLCPLELVKHLEALHFFTSSHDEDACPLQQVNRLVDALDPLLSPMWSLEESWFVKLGLFHLIHGVKAADPLKQILGACPSDPLEDLGKRAETEMRFIAMRFHNKFASPQGNKEIAERFQTSNVEEGEDKGDDAWSILTNQDMGKLYRSILDASARHGRTLPRAYQLKEFEEFRLNFPDAAEERVLEMGNNQVLKWCKKFEGIFEDMPQNEGHSVDFLLHCIKRLRNEPRWPPAWPVHIVLDEPKPRIRVTEENGAHSYTFELNVPSKAKILITEGGIVQQNYFLRRSKNVDDADCGFELERNPAGKPLETYFKDLKEAPQSEICIELDEGYVSLKWREQPPRAINAQSGLANTDCEFNILLPCHATDVTHVGISSKRITFKRFLLKITGSTSCQQLKDFLQVIQERATLKRKTKGGWFETAEQLRDIMLYILNPIPASPDQGPGLVYNFSPTMLDCMIRARVTNARKHCREAVGLHNVALDADETKRELVKVLIPNEDGERVKTLVFEPNRWKEMAKYVEALKSMGMLVEAFSLDLTSLDTFLQWFQQQQSVTAPLFVCVRVTGRLSLSDLARVHKSAANNEALSILLQVDQHVAAALYMTGILRDPTVMKVNSNKGVADEMVLFRSHQVDGEPGSDVGCCVLRANDAMKCLEQQDMEWTSEGVLSLSDEFEVIAEKYEIARKIYPFSETCQLRLMYGDVDAAREAFKEHSGDHMEFIDVAADLDLYQCTSRISSSEQVTEVIVLHTHFLNEVQKKSLLEEFGAKPNSESEWARDRVSVTFVSPSLHPGDFELGPEAVVQWAVKPHLDRRKQISRVIGAFRLVMTKEVMAEVEDTQGLVKLGEQDDVSQSIASMLEAKIGKHMEYALPNNMKDSTRSLLSLFTQAVVEEVKGIENLEQDEGGMLPFSSCPKDSREAVLRLAKCAVRVQGVCAAQDHLVPFQVFREHLLAGGFLPQKVLVEEWAAKVFAPLWSSNFKGEAPVCRTWTPVGGGHPLQSSYLLLYFLTDHTLLQQPGYLVMQKDPISTERDAFMERLTRGEDVDYNEVSRLAQFPWGHQCFMQMLCCCPIHMVPKLVVLVPPKQLFVILWNSCPQQSQAARQAFKRLKQMVLDPVLCKLSEGDSSFEPVPLAQHMAVARWCILKVDGDSSEVTLRDRDINTLFEMREHVAGIQHMATQFPFLVPQMLALDTPRGFIYQQLALRDLLLRADVGLKDLLFGTSGGQLGAILIEFLLHPKVPRDSRSEVLRHPFTRFWQSFIDQTETPDLQHPTSELKDLLLRMSPSAFGQVLESCPTRGHVDALISFMLKHISTEEDPEFSLMLWKGFLADVVQRSFPLKLRAIDLLCRSSCPSFCQAAKNPIDLINQATLMIRVFNKEDPGLWKEHVPQVGFLPLVESEMLTTMVIDKYGGMWTSEVESHVHLLLGIVDKDGFQKLFRLLSKCSLKFLAWAKMPVESISLYLDSQEDVMHLNQIVALPEVAFKEHVLLNEGAVSPVARFLCKKPLPRDEFMYFAEMIGAPKDHIDQTQHTFVICQKDHDLFAPYILRVKAWNLSVDELTAASAYVDSLYENDCKPFTCDAGAFEHEADLISKLNLDVSSGFSHNILKRNLIALKQSALIGSTPPQFQPYAKTHIQAVLWCWFESLLPSGVDPRDMVLHKWLHLSRENFELYIPKEGPQVVKSLTSFPLPSVANTSLQVRSMTRMFESRRESASFTLVMFSRLAEPLMHPSVQNRFGKLADVTDYRPPIADDLLISKEQNSVEVLYASNTYISLHETWIKNLYAPGVAMLLRCKDTDWQSASNLECMLRVLNPFAIILSHLAKQKDFDRVTESIDSLLATVKKVGSDRNSGHSLFRSAMATVHRALHLSLGISQEVAFIHCEFIKGMKKHSLTDCMCQKTLAEIEYMQRVTSNWFKMDDLSSLSLGAKKLAVDTSLIHDFSMSQLNEFLEKSRKSQEAICAYVDEKLQTIPESIASSTNTSKKGQVSKPRHRPCVENPFKVGHRSVIGSNEDLAITREPLQELVQSSREVPAFVDCEGFMEVRPSKFSCTVVVVPGSFARLHECEYCGSLKVCGSAQNAQQHNEQEGFACRICNKTGLKVITDFPSHGHAYEYLIRQPDGLTLLLPGLLLVRRGGVWIHMISSEKLTEENASSMVAQEINSYTNHDLEEGAHVHRYFFYHLLDTSNFLHLQYLNRDRGKMFNQVLFPVAQLLRKTLLSKMQLDKDASVQHFDVKTPHGELLDWLRQFEFLPVDHEFRKLFRSEHNALTQAVINVSKQVTLATTADVLRKRLEDAHPAFKDKKACDSLQAEASFFDALLGFVNGEESRNQLFLLLDDSRSKHPAQQLTEESFKIVKLLGGETLQSCDLQAIENCLRSGTVHSSGNGCTGWRSIAAMQPVDDVSGDKLFRGDGSSGGEQPSTQAREKLEVAAYEKVHSSCGPPVDHLFCQCLDPLKHHEHYTSAEGLQVSYMLPVSLLCQKNSSTNSTTATREGLNWVVDVLRSPMSMKLQEIVLYHLAAKSGHILAESDAYSKVREELEHHGQEIMDKIKYESPDDKWVLHGLQQACPFPEIMDYLSTWTNGLGVNDKEQELAKRRRGRYGVHLVPLTMADKRRGVPKVTARVEKVQLRRHFKSGLMAAPAVFKLIEASFTANCHFVSVSGLPTIPDDMLKWLAEYTAANPWRTVFLMDTDASLKLPENLDRCTFHGNSRRKLPNLTKVKLEPPNMKTLHAGAAQSIRRRANREWKQRILEHLNSDENHIPLLLAGGPGIGKTHTAESQIRDWCNKQGFKFMTLDGSSPALINSSLSDFLERVFTKSHARQIVFVVDEWHMMSDERKRQALQFFLTELRVIPILLSNRFDSTDEELLKLAYGNVGFKPHRHIVACSLTSDEYISVMVSNGWMDLSLEISRERVCYFLEAVRMMFGDEVIGFSMREDLKRMCEQFDNQKDACSHMSNILEMKVAYLDGTWRNQALLPCLYEVMRSIKASSKPAFPEDAADFLSYLLPTARCDASEDMASYIEYVRDHVPNSFKHHPHHLIYSYLLYRYEFAEIDVDEERKQKMFQACCRQNVVGMPMLFPRLLVDPKPADEYTDVICQEVDPNNLSDVIHALKRGMSPDWTQCKAYWKMEGITDVVTFIQLVSVWPDTVHYVDKQNLFDLLESSGDEGMTLARSILNEMSAEPADPKDPMNLYFMASWWCYRCQGGPGALIIGEQKETRFAATQDRQHFNIPGFGKVDLQSLLCWASANSCHHTTIFNMSKKDFSAALKSDLLAVSTQDEQPVLGLWDQQFAFLLSVGDTPQDIPWRWMANLVEAMSRVHHLPSSEWPEEARALFELWEGKMHPPLAEFLAVDNFFSMLHLLESHRSERYLRHLFRAVQEAHQPLPAAMQAKLLTASLTFPDELAQPTLARSLLPGLRILQENRLPVAVPPCLFRKCLQDIAEDENLSQVVKPLIQM